AMSEAGRLSDGEARRPVDFAEGPLLRAALLRTGERRHRLLVTVHHLAGDDWSTWVLTRELAALYAAFAAGRPSPLPDLAVQYADYAAWHGEWLEGAEAGAQLAFWRRSLGAVPEPLDLPFDRPRPPLQSFRGARHLSRLDALEARGATPFMVLMAGFAALLHRYTGASGLVIAAPLANRLRPGTQELI